MQSKSPYRTFKAHTAARTSGLFAQTSRHANERPVPVRAPKAAQAFAKPASILPPYSYKDFYPERIISFASHFSTLYQVDKALQEMMTSPAIGFDIEWKPQFRAGMPPSKVAVVQLADEKNVVVIQLASLKTLPIPLRAVLESADIIKLGVGIDDDATKLERDWDVTLSNALDLTTVARAAFPQWDVEEKARFEAQRIRNQQRAEEEKKKREEEQARQGLPPHTSANGRQEREPKVPSEWKPRPIALGRLCERHLSRELLKPNKLRRSNWEQKLEFRQVEYAANDAAVAIDIYYALKKLQTEEQVLSTT